MKLTRLSTKGDQQEPVYLSIEAVAMPCWSCLEIEGSKKWATLELAMLLLLLLQRPLLLLKEAALIRLNHLAFTVELVH